MIEAYGAQLNEVTFEEWMDALESGQYEQDVEGLNCYRDGKPSGFCCLGVYTDLLIKKNPEVMHWEEPDIDLPVVYAIPVCNGRKLDESFPDKNLFPFPFQNAEYRADDIFSPVVKNGGAPKEVADLNDRSKASFKEIANVLRAEYAERLEKGATNNAVS